MPILKSNNAIATKSDNTSENKKVNKKLDLLDQKMDSLYRNIYVSRSDNKQNMDTIMDRLDNAIDNLQSQDMSVSGMSELLRRISNNSMTNTNSYLQSVEDLFGNQNLIDSLFANEEIHKYISSQNYQFDLICKYIPKLLEALEIKKDNVLCSDNFSKEFLNPKSVRSSKNDAINFAANAKRLELDYDLNNFFEKTYMNCSKYGEDFIYIVPYNIAFQKLISRANYRRNSARLGQINFYESTDYISNTIVKNVVTESFVEDNEYKELVKSAKNMMGGASITESKDNKFKGCEVNLHFNDSGIVTDSINEKAILSNKLDIEKFKSLSSIHETSLMKQFDKINITNDKLSNSSDGLIVPELLNQDPKKIDKNIRGAVVERLPRECVIPVYIGKKCFGYYYLEFKEDPSACGFCGNHHTTPGLSNTNQYGYEMSQGQNELAIRYISSKISAAIDTHFINANKDLKEEIYQVLRYNEKFDISRSNDIGVTFLPAEDVIHCYFEFDEDTHRGISDLQKSVIPAMLYILLYLTDIIGKITRSTDKRIYYIKQNVETNVARTMMNVVQQIKKGNFGARQIESMNNILNIVGKYNDFIIPLGQSGDAPIQFEVMNGQDIQTPTDIMEKMEEAAVNSTGVPIELVNSTMQQDFAIRYSMTNSRFLKNVSTRQRQTQKWISKIYTKVYNYENGENNSYIEVILPPPTYLIMSNNQQLFDNVNQLADKIIESEMTNESDELKAEFKRLYIRSYLSTYMDYSNIERLIDAAKVNLESIKEPAVEEDSGSDEDYL